MKRRKTTGAVAPKTTTTRRLNVSIDADAYDRLYIHALKTRQDPGKVVEQLIALNLRRFRLQDLGQDLGPDDLTHRPESDGPVMESVAA